ncbi:TolB family protein [Ekhidna sp. To15]|uniref:TolB family protein n=1 Tax=Ekhidna sp. To15 TaxID=3395267 RepID=UPI003F51DE3B
MKLKLILIFILFYQCTQRGSESIVFPFDPKPGSIPIPFYSELIPDSLLVHRGVLSNNFSEYYYVTSDKVFQNFHINVVSWKDDKWSKPNKAWFNSEYDDHGVSFSPDGNRLLFSSTRPVGVEGIPQTWHLWQSIYKNGEWSEPEFIDIPNLRNKLVSHPTISPDRILYFHVSDLDYSNMNIYFSELKGDGFQDAHKLSFEGLDTGTCTPYISGDGQSLFFASIEENLPICLVRRTKDGWGSLIKLPSNLIEGSQANPYISLNNQFIFYASEDAASGNWYIKWADISFLTK